MKNASLSFFACLCVLILSVPFSPGAETPARYVEEGKKLLNHQPDTALYRFMLAYKNGMSRDSLKYFWAEIYKVRGVYDSALILNHAVGWEKDKKEPVFRQRIEIYHALGWNKKAESLRDSLAPGSSQNMAFPVISIQVQGDYAENISHSALNVPFVAAYEHGARDTIIRGPAAGGNVSISWKAHRLIQLLAETQLSKPYYGSFNADTDSSDFYLGAGVKIIELLPGNTIRYMGAKKWQITADQSLSHDLGVSQLLVLASNMLFLSVSYGIETSVSWKVRARYLSAISYLEKRLKEGSGIYGTVGMFRYMEKPLKQTPLGYITELYEAQRVSEPLELFSHSIVDTLQIQTVIPQEFVFFNASVGYRFHLPYGFSMRTEAQYGYTKYLDRYQWSEIDASEEDFISYYDTDVEGIFLGETERGYELLEKYGGQYYTTTQRAYRRRSASRTDNRITVKSSITREMNPFGAFTVRGSFSRTWSTLKDAPVRIPTWGWMVGMVWKKTFDPNSAGL